MKNLWYTFTFYKKEKEKELSHCKRPRCPPSENKSQYTLPKEKSILVLNGRVRRGRKSQRIQETSNLMPETLEEKLKGENKLTSPTIAHKTQILLKQPALTNGSFHETR